MKNPAARFLDGDQRAHRVQFQNRKAINLITYSENIASREVPIEDQAHAKHIETHRLERSPFAVLPATVAGVYLCRRYSINPEIADLVAALAGLGNRRIA
jgi:hypothetical protein